MTARSDARAASLLRAEKAKALSERADIIMSELDSVVDELALLLKVITK